MYNCSKKFLKKKYNEFKKIKNRNIYIKNFINEYFNIKIDSLKNYEYILLKLIDSNIFTKDNEINFYKCQTKLIELILNNNEQQSMVDAFKKNFKMFQDDDYNDYFGNIFDDELKIEYVVIGNSEKKFNVEDIVSFIDTCITAVIYRNNNFYILYTDDKSLFDIRDDLIIDMSDLKLKFKKVHNIKELFMKNQGKDWIKHYLCEKNIQGKLYFITFQYNDFIFYKVGITKYDVESRYKGISKEFKILEKYEYSFSMLECSIIEKFIHDTNRLNREISDLDFEGKTECYFNNIHNKYCNIISELLNLSLEYLDSINYPISSRILKQIIKEKNEL